MLSLDVKKPLYFRHIPKTAGSSVRVWLFNAFELEKLCQKGMVDQFFSDKHFSPERYSIYSAHCHGYMDDIIGRETIQCAVLRDPIIRTYSHWREICRSPYHPHHLRVSRQGYEEFVNDDCNDVFIRNFQARYLCPPRVRISVLASQMSDSDLDAFKMSMRLEELSMDWTEKEIYDHSSRALHEMLAVGTVGQLDSFFESLSYRFNVQNCPSTPRENVLSGGATESLSPASLIRLQNMTAVDRTIYERYAYLSGDI